MEVTVMVVMAMVITEEAIIWQLRTNLLMQILPSLSRLSSLAMMLPMPVMRLDFVQLVIGG
jgi:hypothetical protein